MPVRPAAAGALVTWSSAPPVATREPVTRPVGLTAYRKRPLRENARSRGEGVGVEPSGSSAPSLPTAKPLIVPDALPVYASLPFGETATQQAAPKPTGSEADT